MASFARREALRRPQSSNWEPARGTAWADMIDSDDEGQDEPEGFWGDQEPYDECVHCPGLPSKIFSHTLKVPTTESP